MIFDIYKLINKLEKLSLKKSKYNVDSIDLTSEEIEFMRNVFNTIINSDNYDTIIDYLAGTHDISVSNINFIKNVYFYYFATTEEKLIYSRKIKEKKKIKRKEGFIDITAMISITIVISVVGITLAFIFYNLM